MSSGEKSFKRHTVTSALPYANGPSHIGHLAGAYLPADIFVRYLRSKGEDVVFLSGSDEHGTSINIKAIAEGISPREVVDKYHAIIKDSFSAFNISFDHFSRTSTPLHHETAQEFFLKFYNEGKFIQKTTEQLYDEEKQMFLADRFVIGTCPNCGNEEAYGNQCESCGRDLSPSELLNPRSKVSGSTPILKETTHWFLPLDDYQEFLEDYILKGHTDWKANVYGQCKSWLQDGLRPRSITRDLDWGVKVPVPEGDGKVLYVWFDAPIGYITATKEWAEAQGKDWEPYWKDDETALYHFIGKDNIVFHCLIFPSILKGHGDYILPTNVPANEFLNLEGRKISTSKNWAIWMHEFAAEYPQHIDTMRYVLTALAPETKDSEFTWAEFKTRNDNELVATFANFVNRVKVLTLKNFEGVPDRQALTADETAMVEELYSIVNDAGENISHFRFREALNDMMKIARLGDKYLSDLEPWKLVKVDKAAAGHVLNLGLNITAVLATVAAPFMPDTANKVFDMLQIDPLAWTDLEGMDYIAAGHTLKNIAHLFQKIDPEMIEKELERLHQSDAEKEETTFDAFQGMDIRIGTILEAEKVKKADKLLKFLVDTGLDQRTIVSGVALHFQPEELIGKQVLVLGNLKPRKIRGVESQGMILFAEDPDGKLHLVNPEVAVQNGSVVN
ncbi:UNVERIFIED_CONTAM: hypothetical protein GTU68_037527 [Idotea baltica]|nr:hypothetical protein [Idotea baltica]